MDLPAAHNLVKRPSDWFANVSPEFLYVPYNHQCQDYMWGCAWRSLSMVLLNLWTDGPISFKKLVQRFRKRENLLPLARQLFDQKDYQLIQGTKFQPSLNLNWAQPFIGLLVLHSLGIRSRLLLVNGLPAGAIAPGCVFKEPALNFLDFALLLRDYFQRGGFPVMIDDSIVCVAVFAATVQPGQVTLVVGDPHIESNLEEESRGIYKVVLDEEGMQLSNSSSALPLKTPDKIHFAKEWMVLLREPRI